MRYLTQLHYLVLFVDGGNDETMQVKLEKNLFLIVDCILKSSEDEDDE